MMATVTCKIARQNGGDYIRAWERINRKRSPMRDAYAGSWASLHGMNPTPGRTRRTRAGEGA